MSEIETANPEYWKKCNSCKKVIKYNSKYWVCNVSTCTRKRTGLVFCDVSCWDAHVPGMNHKESWAVEKKAPKYEDWIKILKGELQEERAPKEEKELTDRERIKPPPFTPKVIRRTKSE